MTKTLRAVVVLCLLALVAVAAGCGSSSSSAGADPAAIVPESSFFYAEVTIDPQGSQEQAVRSILADLPGRGAPQDRVQALIRQAIQQGHEQTKLDWDKDVKPWLGDRIGVFAAATGQAGAGRFPGAVVVPTTDEDAARKAIEKDMEPGDAHKTYRDVEYVVSTKDGNTTATGVVNGYVVSGDDGAMRAAIDAWKDSRTLDKTDRFKQAVGGVSDDRVGYMYVDLGGLLQLASQASGNQFPGALFGRLAAGKPIVITARAENQALVFEGKGSLPTAGLVKSSGDSRPVMEDLPAGSWAALAAPGFGDGLRSLVTSFAGVLGGERQLADQVKRSTGLDVQKDLLSWIGDVGLFVDGASKDTIGGGAVITSKDPATSKAALTKIAAAVTRNDPTVRVAAARLPGAFGYQLRSRGAPRSAYMVQAGRKVAITYGKQEARDALSGGGLASSADFKRAAAGLGGGFSPSLYVNMAPILRLADASAAASDKSYAKAKPYLTILDYLIAGGTHSGDNVGGRVRLGFKPHG